MWHSSLSGNNQEAKRLPHEYCDQQFQMFSSRVISFGNTDWLVDKIDMILEMVLMGKFFLLGRINHKWQQICPRRLTNLEILQCLLLLSNCAMRISQLKPRAWRFMSMGSVVLDAGNILKRTLHFPQLCLKFPINESLHDCRWLRDCICWIYGCGQWCQHRK